MSPPRWLGVLLATLAVAAAPACGMTGVMKDGGAYAGLSRTPTFPDPPPPPAASMSLPRELIAGEQEQDLHAIHERLTSALEAAGFSKWSIYAFRDGFALVTQWEKVDEEGRPAKRRFSARHPKRIRRAFDFSKHAQLLFYESDGDYRLFVFTVAGSDDTMTADVPIDGDGASPGDLPEAIEGRKAADWQVEAQVHLYRKSGSDKAVPIEGSTLDATTHLDRAGIFQAAQLAGP